MSGMKKRTELLECKVPSSKYTKKDIEDVINYLDQNMHPQEIANLVDKFSATQVKKIRWILSKGTEDDKKIMYECKWYLSSIKKVIQHRKRNEKKNTKRNKISNN